MSDIHEISLSVLEMLEEEEVDIPLAVVATALTLGRLTAPTTLEVEQEVAFIKAIMEFVAVYFVEGPVQ